MAGTSPAMTVDNTRSPDGAERNPGLPRGVDAAPDFAPLHPGLLHPSYKKRHSYRLSLPMMSRIPARVVMKEAAN
jgi:hypothetical protein